MVEPRTRFDLTVRRSLRETGSISHGCKQRTASIALGVKDSGEDEACEELLKQFLDGFKLLCNELLAHKRLDGLWNGLFIGRCMRSIISWKVLLYL